MKTQKDVTLVVIQTEITVIESVEIPKNKEINVTATFNKSTFDLKIDSGLSATSSHSKQLKH